MKCCEKLLALSLWKQLEVLTVSYTSEGTVEKHDEVQTVVQSSVAFQNLGREKTTKEKYT